MAEVKPLEQDAQIDFSGGANPFAHVALLSDSEADFLTNCFPRVGGGVEARKGYKLYNAVSTDQGTAIFEMNQSTGTIMTFVDVGSNYYDETMQPNYRLFNQTPGTNDAVYFGAREKFNALILNILFPYVVAGNTFLWRVSNGSGGWIDKTSSIIETITNSKQMRGVTGEWTFSWPDFSDWLPNAVETRTYQYWLQILCNLGGTNGGSDVFHGQRRVRGDWVGRRHLITTDIARITEWPGLTQTPRAVESWPTGQRIQRTQAAMLNDYLYYSGDGQKPLRRWNGSRGVTRTGVSNNPVDAGLLAPSAPTLSQPTANAAAYPNGFVVRYRLAFDYGPESILGESPPSASAEITISAGPNNVRVTFTSAKTQAASRDVAAIRVYGTINLAATTSGSERDRIAGFLLLKRILRDDADWINGYWEDTYVQRGIDHPISYTNTPPFYPKGVVAGGERLWIWNELFVAASDIDRGDSWDPVNTFGFDGIKGIAYRGKKLFVFTADDIQTIEMPPVGLPDVQYFWRGVGCHQPDTIATIYDQIHFVSREGPARVIGERVELTGKFRVFEDSTYWNGQAPQRRLGAAAGFDGRVWFAADGGGSGPAVKTLATLSLLPSERGAWSRHQFNLSTILWGTFGVVHAPLDHPLARQSILCAFADGSYPANYYKLAILEYGTTDAWTTVETDGTIIQTVIRTRAIALGAADRFKSFVHGHLLLTFRRTAATGITVSMRLQSNHGRANSQLITFTPLTTNVEGVDVTFLLTDSGGGESRDTAPSLLITATSDTGFILASWVIRGRVEDYRL